MAILKFSASAVAAQIAHARACKTFLPNWNGPVDRP
ncbi:MAG: regulator, partial [Alphaproteobacteria bacterium]